MIDQAMKQNTQEKLPVIPVDSERIIATKILEFMYTGQTSVSSSRLDELCYWAENYRIERLVEICKQIGGSTSLNPECEKIGGSTSLNPGCEKIGGSTSMNPGCEKIGGSTSLNPECEKIGGSTSLNPGCEKIGGSTSLNPGCEKIGGSTSLNPEVKPEPSEMMSDSYLKHEDAVPMRWEYNSQETPQDTSSLYCSELGAPVPDYTSQSEGSLQEFRGADPGVHFSNISQNGDNVQDVERMDLVYPFSNSSETEDTHKEVKRVDLVVPFSNITQDTTQEVRRVDLSIVKQEMTESPDDGAECNRSRKGALPLSTLKSATPAILRLLNTASQLTSSQNLHLDDRGGLGKVVIKREPDSSDDQG